MCENLRVLLVEEICKKNHGSVAKQTPDMLPYLDVVSMCVTFLEAPAVVAVVMNSFSEWQRNSLEEILFSSKRLLHLACEFGYDLASKTLGIVRHQVGRISGKVFVAGAATMARSGVRQRSSVSSKEKSIGSVVENTAYIRPHSEGSLRWTPPPVSVASKGSHQGTSQRSDAHANKEGHNVIEKDPVQPKMLRDL